MEGEQEFVLSEGSVCGPERGGGALHWGDPEPRAGAAGVVRADDEFLPAAGARVRGADQSDLLAAEPERLRAHTGLLAQREVEADRVSLSGRGGEPLPGDERHAAGGIGRHAEEADAARAHRQGPLRVGGGGEGQGKVDARELGGGSGGAGEGPRI